MKDRDFPFGDELDIFTSKVRTGKVFTFMEMEESETDIRCLEIPVNAILSDNRPDCFLICDLKHSISSIDKQDDDKAL